MKRLSAGLILLALLASPALAQWQTSNHSIPVGRGAGITGFKSVGPCGAGSVIIGMGLTSDPVCGTGVLNVIAFGADPTGAADSYAALMAAYAACPARGCAVYFPRGKYTFLTSPIYTFSTQPAGMHIFGDAPEATILNFPNATYGLQFSFFGPESSVTINDLTLLTGQIGGQIGLALLQPDNAKCLGSFTPSYITNVIFRGEDLGGGGGTDRHWEYAFYVKGVSGTNLTNSTVWGGAGTGVGAAYTGNDTGTGCPGITTGSFSVQHNLVNFSAENVRDGVQVGTQVQGIQIANSNFIASNDGVNVLSGDDAIGEVSLQGSQITATNNCVEIQSAMQSLAVQNNPFLACTTSGVTTTNVAVSGVISGNSIIPNTPLSGKGINIQGPSNFAGQGPLNISDNVISQFATAISLGATSSQVQVGWNSGLSNTTFISNSGTNNIIPTGSGSIVQATSPALVTPNIGVATATSLNGNFFTGGTYTLTGAAGKTFTFSNTLTMAGTDGSTLNIGTGGTLGTNAYTSTAFAPLASPAFTGTPTAPTAAAGTNTTQIATTAGIVAERAATKTLTNTTYDTAGAGNSFSINGVAATANAGTGSVVRATSPSIASPTFSGTVAGANTIPLTILAQSAANTMNGNWTGSTANVTANAMPSCSDTTGNHLNYVSGTGITCGTSTGPAAAGTLTGATLAAGVTGSSLTSVGALASGSLAAGFTTVPVSVGGTGDTGTAWPTTTPTVTCQGGTPTAVTASVTQKTLGKSVLGLSVNVAITTLGTCTGYLSVPLPNNALADTSFSGLNKSSDTPIYGLIAAGTPNLLIFASGLAAPGSNGHTLNVATGLQLQ